jgi:hypothetical protein
MAAQSMSSAMHRAIIGHILLAQAGGCAGIAGVLRRHCKRNAGIEFLGGTCGTPGSRQRLAKILEPASGRQTPFPRGVALTARAAGARAAAPAVDHRGRRPPPRRRAHACARQSSTRVAQATSSALGANAASTTGTCLRMDAHAWRPKAQATGAQGVGAQRYRRRRACGARRRSHSAARDRPARDASNDCASEVQQLLAVALDAEVELEVDGAEDQAAAPASRRASRRRRPARRPSRSAAAAALAARRAAGRPRGALSAFCTITRPRRRFWRRAPGRHRTRACRPH